VLTPNPPDRFHCQHSPSPLASNQKRAVHQAQSSGGQFWTPIPRLRGSKLHAE
jgi:hypothetical protein